MTDAARTAPAVCGTGLVVSYRGHRVIDVPAISIEAGRTYALLGASGAGKSTLLRVLGLLERPTSGTVSLDGVPADPGDLAARRRIAAVFQRPYLLRGTVGENVAYGLRVRGVPSAERDARVAEALRVVGLPDFERRSGHALSGGEAQRVALARALVLEPSFLLLDEPLSYLDPLLRRELTAEFARILASRHVTALYVTHDQDEAAIVADRIGVMRDGRIVAEGVADDVLGAPADEWLAAFVGMEPPMPGRVLAGEEGLAQVRCGEVTVLVARDLPVGADVALSVRPEDVTLYAGDAQLPPGSARNRLACEVVDVRPRGGAMHVVLSCAGTVLAASVSRASAAELDLRAGARVLAVFKATAVRARLARDEEAATGTMMLRARRTGPDVNGPGASRA